MSIIKNFIKYILGKFDYTIRKNPPKDIELITFNTENEWLKEFNIAMIIDIGANEGQFAKKILNIFPNTTLHCIEPLHEPFQKLQKNLSDHDNVHFYECGLGSIEGDLKINQNEFSPSSSFLEMADKHKENFDYAIKSEKNSVKIKRLDRLGIVIDKPTLIKIDVQGFEDQVIEGGSNIISNSTILIIEVSFKKLYIDQPLFDDIYKSLDNYGFVYHGNIEQLRSPIDGEILQADAVFIKRSELTTA